MHTNFTNHIFFLHLCLFYLLFNSVVNSPVRSDLKSKSNRTDKKSSQTKPNQIDLKPQVKPDRSDRSVPSARRHRSHRSHRPTVGQFDLESGHFDLKSGQFDLKVVILTSKVVFQITWHYTNFQKGNFVFHKNQNLVYTKFPKKEILVQIINSGQN